MRRTIPIILGLTLCASVTLSASEAYAGNGNDYKAKPLTVVPSTESKPKEDPNAFPQAFTDERRKIKDDFNALQKEYTQIQADCDAARTPAAHALCDRNKELWKNRLSAINARTREYHRKVDTWRRKQAGLPPPEWWPQPPQKNGQQQSGGAADGTAPKQDNSVLLPDSSTALPPNTF